MPTLEQVIDLTRRLSRELDREIGIYPKTKHPSYFRSIGLPLEPPLVRVLRRNGLDRKRSKVFVQSFETGNLKALDRELDVPLVQLFGARAARPFDFVASGDTRTYGDLAAPAGLREVAGYADGVGPSKDYIVPRDASGASLQPTSFVSDAHRAACSCIPTPSLPRTKTVPPRGDPSVAAARQPRCRANSLGRMGPATRNRHAGNEPRCGTRQESRNLLIRTARGAHRRGSSRDRR